MTRIFDHPVFIAILSLSTGGGGGGGGGFWVGESLVQDNNNSRTDARQSSLFIVD